MHKTYQYSISFHSWSSGRWENTHQLCTDGWQPCWHFHKATHKGQVQVLCWDARPSFNQQVMTVTCNNITACAVSQQWFEAWFNLVWIMSAKSGMQLGAVAIIWMLHVQIHHNLVMDLFYSRGSVEYIWVGSFLLYFIYSFNYSELITIFVHSPYLALIKLLGSHLLY